ncbi:MAG: hypothetical protein RLZZ282_909, partial [Verrucomicrobiota bacterium]
MKLVDIRLYHRRRLGFTLAAILVVTGALFVFSLGILSLVAIERHTTRSLIDGQGAELAARAGLAEVCATLDVEAANDDYMILQSALLSPIGAGREPAPHLFLARANGAGNKRTSFRYVPLFSASEHAPDNSQLAAPQIENLLGASDSQRIDFTTLRYQDKVRAAWHLIHDTQGRAVARYAYWVEDLQGKLAPKFTGNLTGPEQTHARAPYPFPAPGINPAPAANHDTPLDQIALYAIDPTTTATRQGALAKTLIRHRSLLLSPDSALAAAQIAPPLVRNATTGRLIDVIGRAAEENLTACWQPYFERPLIPAAPGIDAAVVGMPRMNLNALLVKTPTTAVDEMAAWIQAALPEFEQRKGGFPDDYVKTLAANAIDYADADSTITEQANEYRGVDATPLTSEIALEVNYAGISHLNGRKIMTFRFKLFAELFNPTNQPVTGGARLSYEVALPMDSIGAGIGGEPFDSKSLLSDAGISTHELSQIDGRYWSPEVQVSLQPNQYQCYLFADVSYRMDVGTSSDYIPNDTPFSLNEDRGASGLSLMWNGTVVERAESILRQAGLIYSISHGRITGGFKVGTAETITKAALPGHVYDDYPSMYYNMGDLRMTHYLRSAPLDENAYPENTSPNRRNIRLVIYQNDALSKPKVYARMLPSEWPDGGHNAAVGTWSPGTHDKTEMTDERFDFPYDKQMGMAAPQFISNLGRFYSVTELGRVFDPVMHAPVFAISAETTSFRSKGVLPGEHDCWPDIVRSESSAYYGGGNTLRIGRPEHTAFDNSHSPGLHAARLLDLFHVGISRSEKPEEREGPVTRIEGQVNLNTASRDALRALAAGALVMDPLLARRPSSAHLEAPTMAPATTPLVLAAPASTLEGDRIADAIIRCRPYLSTGGLAGVNESNGTSVFGNRALYAEDRHIEWSDAAAEEVFARVYEGATVRSRNFRVW